MKKLLIFLAIIILSSIIGGLYGILNDQITYTISPEYYTKFKFYQFGLMDLGNEAIFPNPRVEVSVVGVMATWWVGLIIGVVLGLVGLIHKNYKQMFCTTMKSIGIAIIVAFLIGFIGFLYGKFYLSNQELYWCFPENLIDKKNFIVVGSIHNFSYIGGLIGMTTGVCYSIYKKFKNKNG